MHLPPSRLLAAGAILSLTGSLAPPSDAREELNSIAAVVNGKVITRSELREVRNATEQMIKVTLPPGAERDRHLAEARDRALDQLIERELVLHEFEQLGGTVKPSMVEEDIKKIIRERFEGDRDKFIAELKKTGMTLAKFEELRRKLISFQVMRAQQGRDIVYATPEDVRRVYEKNKDSLRSLGSVEVRMISIAKQPLVPPAGGLDIPELVPDPEQRRKLANEIHAKLKAGDDFAEMARKFSEDPNAAAGGYRGVITRESAGNAENLDDYKIVVSIDGVRQEDIDFHKQLAAVAFSLETGEISGVLEGTYYFHILKADKRQRGSAPSLDDPKVKEAMQNATLGELREEAVKRWIDHLLKKAQIRKYE